ncbi:MAG TPA: tetratricopeptide repeat protein [Gammaproteobacteria bacterium]|jgi:hypothetical protein
MRAFSTREVAELVGKSQERVRYVARAGFVSPEKTPGGRYRFSFQDLVLLRATKTLEGSAPSSRSMWRALRAVRDQLPPGRPLSSVRVIAADGRILVREGDSAWEAETGQTVFDFAKAHVAGPISSVSATHKLVHADTAEYWFDRGLRFDRAGSHDAAAACYRRAVSLERSEVNSRINLGRLLHDRGSLDEAETLYREALRIEPDNAVAAFNLGVVLEDQGKLEAALASYRCAVLADPELPDAHYNLARLYEFSGDADSAARHLTRFHALTRERSE